MGLHTASQRGYVLRADWRVRAYAARVRLLGATQYAERFLYVFVGREHDDHSTPTSRFVFLGLCCGKMPTRSAVKKRRKNIDKGVFHALEDRDFRVGKKWFTRSVCDV